jgi:hypothetical protein
MVGVLTGAVPAMPHDPGSPKFLWTEAFNTATYAHNRTPTKALGGRTPHEVLYGTKPDVLLHLRTFGAVRHRWAQGAAEGSSTTARPRRCVFCGIGGEYGTRNGGLWSNRSSIKRPAAAHSRPQPPTAAHTQRRRGRTCRLACSLTPRRRTLPLPCNPTTSPRTSSPTKTRGPRRMPSHQHARFTTFRTCPIALRGRRVPASRAMEEGMLVQCSF